MSKEKGISLLNKQIHDVISNIVVDHSPGASGWLDSGSVFKAAKSLEILSLQQQLDLLNTIRLEHFGEGGTIMVGEIELGEYVDQLTDKLNQLSNE